MKERLTTLPYYSLSFLSITSILFFLFGTLFTVNDTPVNADVLYSILVITQVKVPHED